MKKRYIKPVVAEHASLLPETSLMIASGINSNNGIDWGGYDDEGDIIPSAKMNIVFHDMWEEDEESDLDKNEKKPFRLTFQEP